MANHAAEAVPTAADAQAVRASKTSFFRTVRKYRIFYLMMLPALIVLILNNYLPMFGIVIAFKQVNYQIGIWNSPWVGFKNFEYLFLTKDAWIITRNTLGYNALFIVLNLIFPLSFAMLLNELRSKRAAKVHQSIMFLPYILSYVVISYLVYGFINPEHGWLNRTLFPLLGIEEINWYFEQKAWPWILPIINTWKNMGYYTVIYLAAIVGLDDELYEAATIDGAGKWQQMTRITVPLLTPVITIMTLLQIGRIFNADFGLFYLVTRDSGVLFPVTNVIDTYVYRTFLTVGDVGMSSAAGLLQSVVGFVLVWFSNWVVRRVSSDNALF